MGLRRGLEDGSGLRHGLETWGRKGYMGLRQDVVEITKRSQNEQTLSKLLNLVKMTILCQPVNFSKVKRKTVGRYH